MISWGINHCNVILQGNVVLNGLRNGAIVTIDIRERPTGTSNRLIAHRIPCSLTDSTGPSSRKQWFKVSNFLPINYINLFCDIPVVD